MSDQRAVSTVIQLTVGRYQKGAGNQSPLFISEAMSQETVLSVVGTAMFLPETNGQPPTLVLDREKLHAQLDRVIVDVTRKWHSHQGGVHEATEHPAP